MITFNDVTKTYEDGTAAIKRLNLKIGEGEFLYLSVRVDAEKRQR